VNASQGREPARPQQGSGAGGAKNSSAAQPRLSREAVVAFVLLPILLAVGFFLGGRLLGEDTAPTTTAGESTDVDPEVGQPAEDAGDAEDPAAAPTDAPAPIGPVAPTETAPAAEPTTEPSPEPTEAAPTPEPTEAAPAQQPTEAPAPEVTGPPVDASQPVPSDPGLLTSVVEGIPQPTAGDSVLLFRGFAGEDVRTWQARMVERGWDLTVDGIYGERTAEVARAFQVEKGLVVDGLVGPETWSAAWTAPIT
jgi:peptidoglycan hydrolase-like protein with peptidoglycan-binding domain